MFKMYMMVPVTSKVWVEKTVIAIIALGKGSKQFNASKAKNS